MKFLLYKTSLKNFYCYVISFYKKNFLTCFKEAETRTPRLLIMGHSSNFMSCDDISIDQFLILFFFLLSLMITLISSRVALHCKNKSHAIKEMWWISQKTKIKYYTYTFVLTFNTEEVPIKVFFSEKPHQL